MSTRQAYEEELSSINDSVFAMGDDIEKAIDKTLFAFQNLSVSLSNEIMFNTPLNKKQEMNLYFFLLALTAAAAVFAVIVRCFHIVLTDEVPHCVFLAVTGFYCPGCGGSHAG